MADDPTEVGTDVPADFGEAGSRSSEEPVTSPPKLRSTFAAAKQEHLDDLKQQRDRLEAACERWAGELADLNGRMIELARENARLAEANSYLSDQLESERLQRGLVGIVAPAMAAIGGSMVGVVSGWQRWFMGSLLLAGCLFMAYSSLMNLSAEVRRYGTVGIGRRLWIGRDASVEAVARAESVPRRSPSSGS